MEYAGFWLRFGALNIDAIFFLIVDGLTTNILMQLNIDDKGIISIVLMFLYYSTFEASSIQGTIGKKIYGLKVINYNNSKLNIGHAICRNCSKILSAVILGIGFILAGFTPKKQALHDLICKTLVIKSSKPNYIYIVITYAVGAIIVAVLH